MHPSRSRMITLGLLRENAEKPRINARLINSQVSSSIMNYLLPKCQKEIKDVRAAYFSGLF